MGTTQALLVETGDKRDGRGHRIATLARRAELVAEYRQSGLTMAAFARREHLAYSTFAGWVWKSDRARTRGQVTPSPVRFAQVRLPAVMAPDAAASLEVRLVDGTVVRGSGAAELALLVRALRS
jgi:transposase-like protein